MKRDETRRARGRRGSWAARIASLCLVAVAATTAGPVPSLAQKPPPPIITGTAIENEALQLYHDNKLIGARTKAQAALDASPDSVIGHYVMGLVMHEAEGILPKAMYHLGKARELFELRWGAQPGAGGPWRFHEELLFATQKVAGEMEEFDYQLQLLDYHDALYDPDAIAEHAWAYLHLHKYEQAREWAKKGIAEKDPWQRSLGKNALCAVEGEARTRQPQYDACMAALEDARARASKDKVTTTDPTKLTQVAVHAYNAALASYSVLRYDEVERLAREGARRIEFTPANPWRLLSRLYTDGGRVGEAVAAVREMHEWRLRQPASLRDQDRAESEIALATLLLVAGESSTALRLATRALERPDRRGLSSSGSDQAVGATALLRRAIMNLDAELSAEKASVSGTTKRARLLADAAVRRMQTLPDTERVANIMSDPRRLDSTFRPYLSGGIEPVPTWLLGDLVPVLGAGVVAVVLERARREEAATEGLVPYFDALGAEVALAQGDLGKAGKLAKAALEKLPKAESLLSARVAAVGAEAARRRGADAEARTLFHRAMLLDPGVIRRLGLALPARVKKRGSDPVVVRAAELLERSPRLDDDGTGFEVVVDQAGPEWRVCMRAPDGTELVCSSVQKLEGEKSDDRAARLALEFHQNAFAMRVGLTQADLKSLDGSTGLAGQAQREQMKDVLKGLADETN